MRIILTLTLLLLLSIGFMSCSEKDSCTPPTENEEEEDFEPNPEPTNGEILIVYFSRAGENYNVGTVSVGNTALMAGYIQEYTGGAMFEIVPETPYPNDYDEMRNLSQYERSNDLRPAIKNALEDINKYSVVFVGSPIWYGGPPMIVQTFYEAYPELANKTLVPFGTHEGSGTSSCTSLMQRYFPSATILENLGLRGTTARDGAQARPQVRAWIERINLLKTDE